MMQAISCVLVVGNNGYKSDCSWVYGNGRKGMMGANWWAIWRVNNRNENEWAEKMGWVDGRVGGWMAAIPSHAPGAKSPPLTMHRRLTMHQALQGSPLPLELVTP